MYYLFNYLICDFVNYWESALYKLWRWGNIRFETIVSDWSQSKSWEARYVAKANKCVFWDVEEHELVRQYFLVGFVLLYWLEVLASIWLFIIYWISANTSHPSPASIPWPSPALHITFTPRLLPSFASLNIIKQNKRIIWYRVRYFLVGMLSITQ